MRFDAFHVLDSEVNYEIFNVSGISNPLDNYKGNTKNLMNTVFWNCGSVYANFLYLDIPRTCWNVLNISKCRPFLDISNIWEVIVWNLVLLKSLALGQSINTCYTQIGFCPPTKNLALETSSTISQGGKVLHFFWLCEYFETLQTGGQTTVQVLQISRKSDRKWEFSCENTKSTCCDFSVILRRIVLL